MLSAMVSDDAAIRSPTTILGRQVRRADEFYPVHPVDLAKVRAAFTPDFGFAPTERQIAEVFAEKTGLFRHVFAEAVDGTPDCTGADEAFAGIRAVGFLANHLERVRTRPQDVGPNVHADVEAGLRLTAADVAHAEVASRLSSIGVGRLSSPRTTSCITPTITISPRPWTELYPAEIDGWPTKSYFHWLALAYAVTLAGHPAVSMPVGLDRSRMPFGLQIVGPRGGDAYVLAVAAALEELLASDVRTARPVPDIEKLKAAPPISASPKFLGFD